GAAFSNNTANLLVARMMWNSSSFATQSVTIDGWLNPDLDANLAGVAVGAGTLTVTGSIQTATMSVKANLNPGVGMDEIRVANSQAEVMPYDAIPEPSAMALLGGAGVLLVALRRRR